MKKFGLMTLIGISTFAVVIVMNSGTAHSRPQYSKEFIAKYVNATSTDPNDKAFAEVAAEAKCSVCHAGESKKNRNGFGRELAKILHNEKDSAKIDDAFDSVLKMKSDPNDQSSPTYGDLMKQGKLPSSHAAPASP